MYCKNIYNKISIPIIINQDYKIPNFANDKTLFISSSYSEILKKQLLPFMLLLKMSNNMHMF